MMVSIRPMQEPDVNGVMVIENAVCDFPWTPGIFSDCIRVGYSCWVFDGNGNEDIAATDESTTRDILGYALLSVAAGEAHVLNICIKPENQGQGLGKRMMLHIKEEAKKLNANTLFLEVRVSNMIAFNLYKKLGFTVVGHRKDYYPHKDGREDAIVLAIALKKA